MIRASAKITIGALLALFVVRAIVALPTVFLPVKHIGPIVGPIVAAICDVPRSRIASRSHRA